MDATEVRKAAAELRGNLGAWERIPADRRAVVQPSRPTQTQAAMQVRVGLNL